MEAGKKDDRNSGFDHKRFTDDICAYAKMEKKSYIDLSKAFGISPTTTRRIMSQANKNPKMETVYSCCRALQLDPDRYRTGWPASTKTPREKPTERGFDFRSFMRDVAERRAARKISQQKMAELLEISRQAYNKMETRATEEVGVEQIYRLATFMDIKTLTAYMPEHVTENES
jgi:hypothetical protein